MYFRGLSLDFGHFGPIPKGLGIDLDNFGPVSEGMGLDFMNLDKFILIWGSGP